MHCIPFQMLRCKPANLLSQFLSYSISNEILLQKTAKNDHEKDMKFFVVEFVTIFKKVIQITRIQN